MDLSKYSYITLFLYKASAKYRTPSEPILLSDSIKEVSVYVD